MYRILRFPLIAAALMIGSTTTSAQDQWVTIKTQTIDLSAGPVTIDTTSARGRYKALKVAVKKGRFNLQKVIIRAAGGRSHAHAPAIVLKSREQSQPMALRGRSQFIDSIKLVFVAEPGRKVRLDIVGQQSRDDARAQRPKAVGGILLAQRDISLAQAGDESLRSTKIPARFNALRLSVAKHDAYIDHVFVEYTTGKTEQLLINKVVKAGETTVWHKIKDDLPIKQLRVAYKSSDEPNATAIVAVFGKLIKPRPRPKIVKLPTKKQELSSVHIRQIQQNLNDKGFNVGEVDGVWGAQTSGAIASFQQGRGLPPGSTEWDGQTAVLFEQLIAEQGGRPKSKPGGVPYSGGPADDGTDTERPTVPISGELDGETDVATDDCVAANTCTPIKIYFGTNRNHERTDDGRPGFGANLENRLTLGEAIVTVPKAHDEGAVETPSYWSFGDIYRYWTTGSALDPARHFMIPADGTIVFSTSDEFARAVRDAAASGEFEDHALIFIHGFNTKFDEALLRIAQFTYDLGRRDTNTERAAFGQPFLFSWPAKGGGALGVTAYNADSDAAEASQDYLEDFLELVVNDTGITTVHIVAHSMGNQPLLRVLTKFAETHRPGIRFNQIVLAAPDVDKNLFLQAAEKLETARRRANDDGTPPLFESVTLYASSTDEALEFSTNEVHQGRARAGFIPTSGPVLAAGVETIDVSALATQLFKLHHNTYAEDPRLLDDIAALLDRGLRPPHARSETGFIRHNVPATATNSEMEYWAFPSQ